MKVFWRCKSFFEDLLCRFGAIDRTRLRILLRKIACAMNPFSWEERTIKVVFSLFFMIALPVYLYIGFQPNIPADAASYPRLLATDINLDTPVEKLSLDGRQLNVPDMIAGYYSSEQNKTLLVGHSSTVFEKLDQLKIGQDIEYDSKRYKISRIEILEKSEINMSQVLAGAPVDTIVLMTCAGESLPNQDATHRLIITAVVQ